MAVATRRIGPADHGRKMSLDEFIHADFEEGWLYELARGVLEVTEVPGVSHALIVERIAEMFVVYKRRHPGVIYLRAGAGECRLRLPGMQSDRHPDQAVYLSPPPPGLKPWTRWIPDIVVEVVSRGGEARDYEEKREEYLRSGVREYWILDPRKQKMLALGRAGDVWEERVVPADGTYRTHLLPGLVVRPGELLGLGD
ncbi:MAG: Uma2 family endonuclease [Isosphaeraceae bacterium]|nr:Uma2 family endonuclease [Isosphaeraceae bacterium]